jgi:hypothetical protein
MMFSIVSIIVESSQSMAVITSGVFLELPFSFTSSARILRDVKEVTRSTVFLNGFV